MAAFNKGLGKGGNGQMSAVSGGGKSFGKGKGNFTRVEGPSKPYKGADIHDVSTDASADSTSDTDEFQTEPQITKRSSHTWVSPNQAQSRRQGHDDRTEAIMDTEVRSALKALLEGNEELAEQILSERLGKISKVAYHSMIHHCGKMGNLDAAVWCATRMRKSGLKPNIVTFNSLVTACAKVGNLKLGTEWFNLMTDSGLKPNKITYNIMINAAVKARDTAAGEEWMQRMIDDGFEPCTLTYGSIINGFSVNGDVKKAEMWFVKMTAAGVKPDRVLYNSLLNACIKAKNPQKAEYWLQQMRADNISTDEKSYNNIIHAYAKKGCWDKAEQWLQQMRSDGYHPTEVHQSGFTALNIEQEENPIEVINRQEIADSKRCLSINAKVATHFTVPCIDKLTNEGHPMNVVTFNYRISVHAKTCDVASAKRCVEEMLDAGFHPDKVTLTALAQCARTDAASNDALVGWFFHTLTKTYLASGDLSRLQLWLPDMAVITEKMLLRTAVLQQVAALPNQPAFGPVRVNPRDQVFVFSL